MASEQLELEAVIPAAPGVVYRAWLTGDEHARMTGAPASGAPVVGAPHSAWDGYVVGKNLELEPSARILQSWRSTQFPEGAPDSVLEVRLFEHGGGTKLVLRHSEIPEGQGESYRKGWVEHYFDPMRKYFGSQAPAKPKRKPAAKKKAKVQAKAKAKAKAKAASKAPKKKGAKAKASARKAGARGGGRTKKASRPRRR